jgi:hypothetical protein
VLFTTVSLGLKKQAWHTPHDPQGFVPESHSRGTVLESLYNGTDECQTRTYPPAYLRHLSITLAIPCKCCVQSSYNVLLRERLQEKSLYPLNIEAIFFFLKTGVHYDTQDYLKLISSSDLPTLSS